MALGDTWVALVTGTLQMRFNYNPLFVIFHAEVVKYQSTSTGGSVEYSQGELVS